MTRDIILKQIASITLSLYKKANIRKASNFFLNMVERFTKRDSLRSMPVGLDLLSTTRCNFRCIYCKKYNWGDESDLSIENFNRIADYFFPTLLYLKLGSAGEHLLHRNIVHMLRRCHDEGVSVIMNSNGSLLDDDRIDMLLKYNVKVFGLSLDGATQETAEKIRKGLNFQRLLQNLKRLNVEKRRRGLKYPILTANFAAMRSNIEELPQFIRIMAAQNIRLVRVMYLYVHEFMDPDESLFIHREMMRTTLPKAKNEAKRFGVRLITPPDFDASGLPSSCYFPYHEIGLSPDGSVAFCCNAWDHPKMGNVFQKDFKTEIWNSKPYQTLRKTVNTPVPNFELCRECCALDRGANDMSRHLSRHHHDHVRRKTAKYGRKEACRSL